MNMGQLGTFAIQSDKWRLFYALFEMMNHELLQLPVEPTDPSKPIYKRRMEPLPVDNSWVPGDFDDMHDQAPNLGEKTNAIEAPVEEEAEEEPVVKEVSKEELQEEAKLIDTSTDKENVSENGPAMQAQSEEKEEPEVGKHVYVDEDMLAEAEEKKKKDAIEAKRRAKVQFFELEPSVSVFEEFIRVIYSVIAVGTNKNLKVKRLAVYQLFPKLVNLSKPFMQPKHSSRFMSIMVGAMQVEWK